jgi:hypothetical protein
LPFPLIEIMGGVRLSASEQLLKSTAQTACLWGFCTGPIWLVGFIVAASTTRPRWAPIPTSLAPVRTELWVLAALSIAVWAVALPFTQPEQMARKRVERLFAHGKLEEALAQMSTHGPGDFPPNWNPPPRSVNLIRDIDLVVRLMNALTDQPQALWVRELYVVKLRSYLRAVSGRSGFYRILHRDGRLSRLAAALERLPEGKDLVHELEPILRDDLRELSAEDQDAVKRLRRLAGIEEGETGKE